jgi:prepilin-type N-terminal cleavage/methylation domain-containing protein
MKTAKKKALPRQPGFTLLELMISMAVMLVVLGVVFRFIAVATQRSQSEQTKMDLTQQAREFVDEFERDLHQVGYPGCRLSNLGGTNCNAYGNPVYSNVGVAAGLIKLSSYEIGFEGDVDGDGAVDSVWYRVFDSANNFPPTGTCPCTIRRYQSRKTANPPLAQSPANALFTQELQNVINSGNPAGGAVFGNGLPIAGNTMWGQSYTSYYAAIKDFPVFTAYQQDGTPVGLPLDINANTPSVMASVKSIRLTINIAANANTGYDLKTRVLPLMTLVGDGRIANCPVDQANNCN